MTRRPVAPTAPPSSGSAATCGCATSRRSSPPPTPRRRGSRCSCSTRALLGPSGAPRRTLLYRCLRELDDALGGRLLVVRGDPADVVPRVAAAVDAPHGARRGRLRPVRRAPRRGRREGAGRRRPRAGAHRLAVRRRARPGHQGRRHAVPGVHPVPPGLAAPRLARARRHRRRHRRLDRPRRQARRPAPGARSPTTTGRRASCRAAGEAAALARWAEFLDDGAADYSATRDRPDQPGTSRMSVYLKYGAVHPRTLLADLAGPLGEGAETLRTELAWREFYADVLYHRPDSARRELRPPVRRAAARTAGRRPTRTSRRGRTGRTGFPIVDAGMRQLREQAWMHNRVRMIVASFLVKDLHLPWWWGARHFMQYLVDGDLASNQHGWQWVGRHAAPTPRRSSGCSTRSRRASGSTRTATTCAGSCPSCATSAARRCTGRGSCPTARRRLPAPDRRPRRGAPGGAGPVRAGQGPSGLTADGLCRCRPLPSAHGGGAA